jgi:hypothetical protein
MPKDIWSFRITATHKFSEEQCPTSRLYHLELIGTGTPHVESIISYTARLASAHCLTVGNLVSKEIVLERQTLDDPGARIYTFPSIDWNF